MRQLLRSPFALALAILIAAAAARLFFAGLFGPGDDELYYWLWGKHPAWGYFDHPPMTGWLYWLSASAFGDGVTALRLPAILCSLGVGLAAYITAEEVYGRRGGLRAVATGSTLILFAAGSLLTTPDSALLLFYTLSLYFAVKALRRPVWWLAWGAAFGLALLSKYTGLFVAIAPLACLFHPKGRRSLANLYLPAGFAIAALLLLPNLLWNGSHGWVSFSFQAGHGFGSPPSLAGPFNFLVGSLLVLTPPGSLWLLWRGGASLLRFRERPETLVLTLTFALPYTLFLAASLFGPAEANWPATAYISLLLLAAARPVGRLGASLLLSGVAPLVLLHLHLVRPFIPLKNDPTGQFHGWDSVAARLMELPPGTVVANRYQTASQLSYHYGPVTSLNLGTRPNQFDLWERPVQTGRVWLVGDYNSVLGEQFQATGREYVINRTTAEGKLLGRLTVYELYPR